MENREAIEILRGCVVSEERENGKPNGNITCDLTREVLNMAISALEKQEGKKPHRNYTNYSAMWCQCGCYLGFERDGKKYCPNCGQKILWE